MRHDCVGLLVGRAGCGGGRAPSGVHGRTGVADLLGGVAVGGGPAGSDCAAVVAGGDSAGGETTAWLSAVCRLAGEVTVAGGDSIEHSGSSC